MYHKTSNNQNSTNDKTAASHIQVSIVTAVCTYQLKFACNIKHALKIQLVQKKLLLYSQQKKGLHISTLYSLVAVNLQGQIVKNLTYYPL